MAGVLSAWGRALGLSWSATADLTSPATRHMLPPPVASAFGLGSPTGAAPVTREEAMGVPAVRRARDVICSVMAQMPLMAVRSQAVPDTRPGPQALDEVRIRRALLEQPEDGIAVSTTMAWTVDHMIFYGVAWWEVTERDFAGWPRRVRLVHPARVTVSGGRVHVDGQPVRDADIIRFDAPGRGLLVEQAATLRAAVDLASTSRVMAQPTAPLLVLQDTRTADDEPLTATERDALLVAWEQARRTRGVAYLPPSLELKVPAWNAETIGLKTAREQMAVDVARAVNLDPRWLAAPSTDSLTYSNTRDSRAELVSITCSGLMLAIAQRLSMPDVTPGGQRVRLDTTAVLAGTARDRVDDAAAAAGRAPMTLDEARTRILGLPPAQEAEDQPATPRPQDEEAPRMSAPAMLTLAAQKPAAPDPADARRIVGLLLPWDQTVRTALGLLRFARGSVTWSEHRPPLLLDHDYAQPGGVVLSIEDSEDGLRIEAQVDEGERGDDILARLASGSRTGLSAGLELAPGVVDQIAQSNGRSPVQGVASLREVTMTAVPAFDSARAQLVARPAEVPRSASYSAPPAERSTLRTHITLEAHVPTVITLSPAAPDTPGTGAHEAPTPTPAPAPAPPAAPAAGSAVALSERPVLAYDAPGARLSVISDVASAAMYGDQDAAARLAALHEGAVELAVATRSGYDTTSEGGLVREGYRGELMIAPIDARRPVIAALTNRVALTDATPFVIPTVGEFEQVGPHVEGTPHFAEGTLTLGSRTVTPRAISGAWRASRELLDTSNPAIDTIALSEMRRDYADKSEAYAISQITAGLTAVDVVDIDGLEEAILQFEDLRTLTPVVAMGTALWNEAALTKLTNGEPRFPRIAPGNRNGQVNSGTAMDIQGATVVKAPGVGARQAILMRPEDILWGESPVLTFRFDQPEGPGIVKLALWSYQAAAVLRPAGVRLVTIP